MAMPPFENSEEVVELLLKVFQRKAQDILNNNDDFDVKKEKLIKLSGKWPTIIGKIPKKPFPPAPEVDTPGTLTYCMGKYYSCECPPEECEEALWECLGGGIY